VNPPDPRADRNELFGRVLLAPLIVVAATAAVGTLLSGQWERLLAWVTVAVLVVVPILRIGWLISRWVRRGDQRFVAAGCALLAVIAVGVTVASR